MHGGTLRYLYIDPGTTQLGLCLLELVRMVQPPDGHPGVLDPAASDPEPCFRVLAMELVDLNYQVWSPVRGYATVSYNCGESCVIEPDYYNDAAPLVSHFSAMPKPPAKGRKRAREGEGEGEGEGDAPARPPAAKKRRVLRPKTVKVEDGEGMEDVVIVD
jgi:hypothetical protein